MKNFIIIGELIIILSAIFAELGIAAFDTAFALSTLFALLFCCPFSLLLSGEPVKALLPLTLISLFVWIKALSILL